MKLFILLGVLFVCAIVAIAVKFSPRTHRPLSHARPERPTHPQEGQLGMEAVSFSGLLKVDEENRRLEELNRQKNRKIQSHLNSHRK